MTSCWLCTSVLIGLALLHSIDGVQVSPVQKVVQMIDEMAVKVQADLDDTSKIFEEFAKYCDDEATAKNYAIKGSLETIEELKAVIESSDAKISSLEQSIQDLSSNIASQQHDLEKSDQLREKEHERFIKAEQSMMGMVEDLGAAKQAFAGASFAQLTPERRNNVAQVVASLQQVVESTFVTHAEFEKVQAFLQAKEEAEDSLTLASKSDGNDATFGILAKLEERSAATLSDTRKKEQEGANAHAMLRQGIESDIQSMNEEMDEAKSGKNSASEMLASASKDLAVETTALKESRNSMAEVKTGCQTKATQFEEESRDGKAELVALGKAKQILTKKFSSLQVRVRSRTMKVGINGEEDARTKALRHIQQLGKKFHSTALVTLAYRASASPFAKVSAMIEDMIAKLQQEAAEEASQKAFCDKELGTSQKSKDKKEASLRKTSARIDKSNSAVAKLSEAVQTLSQEVADIDAGVSEATTIRKQEKTEFAKVERDFSESEEACAAAISVLRDYYESASLLQASSQTGVHATGGAGIIGLLEVAESDFATLLAEVRTSEETAADEYANMVQEQKMAKMTKEMDTKGKRSQLKSLASSLTNYNQDKDGVSTELDAVLAYLDKLKPQCETKMPSYAEVKAKREAEVSGLKDALNILSGDALALIQEGHYLRRTLA